MKILLCLGFVVVLVQARPMFQTKSETETLSGKHSKLPWVMRESLKLLEKSLTARFIETFGLQRPKPKIWKNFGAMMALRRLRPQFKVQNGKNSDKNIKQRPGSRGPYGARGYLV